MTLGSKMLLYALLAGPVVLVLFVLFLLGPVGWFAIAFLVLGGMAVLAVVEGRDRDDAPPRNCPACGAPNGPERETCGYCGEAL